MVKSQGKVSEKSGNFKNDIEWQPCFSSSSLHIAMALDRFFFYFFLKKRDVVLIGSISMRCFH